MNVLFINEFDWFKSVVFDTHILAEGLSLLGHKVWAIDRDWDASRRFKFRTTEISNAARIYPKAQVLLRRPGFVRFPFIDVLSNAFTHYLEIRKTIRDFKPDIIMLYSTLTSGLQSVHFARKFGIPIIFRNTDIMHNLMPYAPLRIATKSIERRIYPGVDMLLALTPKYAEYLERMGADKSKTELLLFPIDTGIFHPGVDCSEVRQKWGLDETDRVVVWVGTLYEFSGLNTFIRRFPEVIDRVPEAKLLVVGDGPSRSTMERTITELGLEDRVIITGYQPFETMPQYINLATVCINAFPVTNVTRDIFSAKIVQYLACGKPAISTALPGITTLIPGESHGVIYTDTAADMARELVLLLGSPERRQQLGQAGLDYVRREHDYAIITRRLETILEEAIEEKHNKEKPGQV